MHHVKEERSDISYAVICSERERPKGWVLLYHKKGRVMLSTITHGRGADRPISR